MTSANEGLPRDEGLRSIFGDDLLSYILAADRAPMTPTSEQQREQTLDVLRSLEANAAVDQDEAQRRHSILPAFYTLGEDTESIVNQLRALNGGSSPEFTGEDKVGRVLHALARDLFPVVLLPPVGDGVSGPFGSRPSLELSMALYQNPKNVAFASSVLEDSDLARLFPSAADRTENQLAGQPFPANVVAELIWSNGGGGTLQLATMTKSIVEYLFALMRLDGRLEIGYLAEYVRKVLTTARMLATRQRTKVPMVVALSNVRPEDGRMDIPLGCGRLILAGDLGRVFPHVPSDARAILLVETELQLLDVMPFDSRPTTADSLIERRRTHRAGTIERFARETAKDLTRARLTFALASGPDILAPVVLARALPNPLSGGGFSWSTNPNPRAPYSECVVTPDVAARLCEWGERLRNHPDSLSLGSRRLVAATTERLDSLDAFVDAVICWENMLGTDEGEVTFRVCAGLASLLEPDDTGRRLTLYEELKSLYRARSRLVHGSHEPDPGAAAGTRDRAVKIAIDAMRALFARPDLLNASGSTERNRRLLLGG